MGQRPGAHRRHRQRHATRWTGKQHLTDTYRFASALPLRDSDDALLVHWCEMTTTDASGKVLYCNAWATSHAVWLSR